MSHDPTPTATYQGPRPAPLPRRLQRGDAIDRYVILDQIGAGGMGVVYAAYDPQLDRRIALKMLAAKLARDDEGHRRLLREAQALARIDHPNVVAIHDVGTTDGEVFLAMDFVDGIDLARWLSRPDQPSEQRPHRDIIELFVQAGRGLEEAHAAGLVHRDFKPSNVRVGEDGRVRVLDFGLALEIDKTTRGSRHVADDSTDSSVFDHPFEKPLSRQGTIYGTPRYMAPEQLLGARADARSDQYAFCLALWEALHGAMPFAGEDRAERLEAMRDQPPMRARSTVSKAIHRLLERGLAYSPDARFESLGELVDQLQAAIHGRRRRWLAPAALLLIALLTAAWWLGRPGPACLQADDRLDGVWDSERRTRLRQALIAKRPDGAEVWRPLAVLLDSFANDWQAMYLDVCRATHVRHEQSLGLFDLRMSCLDDRRVELRALTDLFIDGPASAVSRAIEASSALSTVDACADIEALSSPMQPNTGAQRMAVDELRSGLAEVRALRAAGEYQPGLELARDLVADAERLDFAPIAAEAHAAQGDLYNFSARYDEAVTAFRRASVAAEEGRHDSIRAQAMIDLMWVLGQRLGRRQEAQLLESQARAIIRRLGDDAQLLMRWSQAAAAIANRDGDYSRASELAQQALRLSDSVYGPEHLTTMTLLSTVASVDSSRGEFVSALDAYRRVARVRRQLLGPSHLHVGLAEQAIAGQLLQLGRFEEALEHLERSLAIAGDDQTSDHVASLLADLGSTEAHLGNEAPAMARLEASLAMRRELHGEDSLRVAQAYNSLGDARLSLGDARGATPWLERCLARSEQLLGRQHVLLVPPLVNLGRALLELDQPRQAESYLRRAEALLPTEHVWTALVDHGLGRAAAKLGDRHRGRLLLERALERMRGDARTSPLDLARVRLDLAEVLADAGDDERSRQLATAAAASLQQAGRAGASDLARAEAWLANR